MKTFWILWTYAANYSDKPMRIEARGEEEAANTLRKFFSADFAKTGTIYVFDKEPVIVGPAA